MTTPAAPVAAPEPVLRFSDILAQVGRDGRERVRVGEVLASFGEQGAGAIMLLFALISTLPLPPGGTTITGIPLLVLSFELAIGRDSIWLPKRVLAATVSSSVLRNGFGWLAPVVRVAENLSRPRLAWLTGRFGQGLIGLACILLSLVLVLPIPLGNIAPAITISLFSLGVMQRDGFAVILACVSAVVSVSLLAFAWRFVSQTVTGLYDQFTNLHLAIP